MDSIKQINEDILKLNLVKPEYKIPFEKEFVDWSEQNKGLSLSSPAFALTSYYDIYKKEIGDFIGDKGEAYVDNSSIVTFVGNISNEFKDDILNSTLFAQFAANAACKPQEDLVKWYNTYQEVLQKLGWVMPGIAFSTYKAAGNTFEVEKAVLEVLGTLMLPVTVSNVVIAALNVMKALPGKDRRIKLFDSASRIDSVGSFQVANCYEIGGNIETALACVHFTTTDNITYILGFNLRTIDATLRYNAQKVNLNSNHYNQIRESVKGRLGASMREYIDKIPLVRS